MSISVSGTILGISGNDLKVQVDKSSVDALVDKQITCDYDYMPGTPRPKMHERMTAMVDYDNQSRRYIIDDVPFFEVATDERAVRNQLFALAAKRRWSKGLVPMIVDRLAATNPEPAEELTHLSYRYKTEPEAVELVFDGLLSSKQISQLISYWRYNFLDRQLSLMGLTGGEIRALTRKLTHESVLNIIKTNPYTLPDLSLDKADAIIENFPWYFKVKPRRIPGEIIRYLMEELEQNHHIYLPLATLTRKYPQIVGELQELTSEAYKCVLINPPGIPNDITRITPSSRLYTFEAYDSETVLATVVARLLTKPKYVIPTDKYSSRDLSPEQWAAIKLALVEPVCIIKGGAGTGKTTLTGEIARQLEVRGEPYAVVSYMGKAVRQIRKRTGLKTCKTIHSLRNEPDVMKDIQVLVIDEASMAPSSLLSDLLRAMPSLKQIIIIGDENQLQPIAWGIFMLSVIWAGGVGTPLIPRVQLLENHRTIDDASGRNAIVEVANALVADTTRMFRFVPYGNLHWFDANQPEILELIGKLVESGYTGWEITIITPYKALTDEFNYVCQDLLNGTNTIERICKGRRWRIGDRVMNLKNMRTIDIMNGEEGQVVSIGTDGMTVKFDDAEHVYAWEDVIEDGDYDDDDDMSGIGMPTTRNLKHSWAMTCHKSQGCEWPVVVAYIPKASNFVTRNMVYVMLTRAIKHAFLFGSAWAVNASINNVPPTPWNSLAERIMTEYQVVLATAPPVPPPPAYRPRDRDREDNNPARHTAGSTASDLDDRDKAIEDDLAAAEMTGDDVFIDFP